ncbi:MAG: excinuclease ABC subunit UvrA [Prevotellaceae bacterium]|nr:excinuclease ABC subunit UvrA [Prevotellaceae bacterium]
MKYIEIKGARVNNLQNISLKIPRNRLIVISGVSGSGKSSLAFDTLYAEGQRRYVESLSSYARQFLGRLSKPEYDFIKGLPPAIAIEQKVIARNPRSTVGTSTEIYEYLRLLFARIGKTISPISGREVKKHTPEDVLTCVQQYSEGTKFMILAPLIVAEGRTLARQLEMALQGGYLRVMIGKQHEVVRIDDLLADMQQGAQPTIEDPYLVIDRLSVSAANDQISRLLDSVETAMYEGDGACRLVFLPSMLTYDFSSRFEADGMTFQEPTDNLFAFNSPAGACPTCEGFGSIIGIDEHLVIPNTTLSVAEGCVQCWHGEKMGEWKNEFCKRAAKDNFPLFTPYYELSAAQKRMLWHGLPSEQHLEVRERVCIDGFFQMVQENTYKIQYRVMLSRYRGKTLCPDCAGGRLRKEAEWVKIEGRSIVDLVQMPISVLYDWFTHLSLDAHDAAVAKRLLAEITNRLHYICQVGLGYLCLNRPSNTLSGGESQRINLTTALGSSLVGSLYILDEPSIGLHSRDTERLIEVLRDLQQLGNTVIVVEHDEEMMRASDYLIDVGPNAGRLGGRIVFEGDTAQLSQATTEAYPESHTIKYLTGQEKIEVPATRRAFTHAIRLRGARMHNLKGIQVDFPLNVLTVVTGVSGSGKSTLVKGILFPALKRHLDEPADYPGEYLALEGDWQRVKHVEMIDQNPIGKSTRSNPATYVKAYDAIRQLFAQQPLAKQMGFSAQYFSFNAEGGRCEECKGAGVIQVEMQFMADLVLECEACHGKRFKKDVLDVKFHDRNIYDVLCMTVDEAIDFFKQYDQPLIAERLQPLQDVGLGYIQLGQSSSTLSGGENQRVKLAYYLGKECADPTLFIFDEPTTGLHFHDIQRLLKALNALIERGHSVIVIEHNMEIIKSADWLIDLGPEGGDKGGNLVFAGRPEDICHCKQSVTGRYLTFC